MIRGVLLAVLILAGGLNVWLFVADREVLVVDEPVFDVGEVHQHSVHEFEFDIHNGSRTNVEVTSIQAACGCTVLDNATFAMSPGATHVVKGTLKTGSMRGSISKRLLVRFAQENATEEDMLVLGVAAHVLPDFNMNHSRLTLSAEKPEAEFVISPARVDDVRISSWQCSHPALNAELFDEEGLRHTLQVSFDPSRWKQSIFNVAPDIAVSVDAGGSMSSVVIPVMIKEGA